MREDISLLKREVRRRLRVLQTSGVDVESQHFSATRCQLASQIAAPTTYIHGVVAATGNGGKCDLVIVNVVIPGHWANCGFIVGFGVSGGSGEPHDWR